MAGFQTIETTLLPIGYHRIGYGKTREVGWVSGCCMLISQQAWQAVGCFDERLYFYREDTEWAYRAKQKGYETRVLPSVEVVHLVSKSTRSAWRDKRKLHLFKGEKYYYACTQGLLHHALNNMLIAALYPLLVQLARALQRTNDYKACQRSARQARLALHVIISPHI